MEVANLIVGIMSLVINAIMLFKVNEILKNVNKVSGKKNKVANQEVSGKKNSATIHQ